MEWPAISQDLNPIEHLWDVLERRIRPRLTRDSTLAELRNILTEEWEQIPQCTINRLVRSMRGRVREVLERGGGHTHYWVLVQNTYWFFGTAIDFSSCDQHPPHVVLLIAIYWFNCFVSFLIHLKEYSIRFILVSLCNHSNKQCLENCKSNIMTNYFCGSV